MSVIKTDALIVGGGLLGLSVAMHLAQMQPRLSVHLIEKDGVVASHQSGRNSGVLHAGIYYRPGSLKARFCVAGREALSAFCDRFAIPVIRCGKVIVANSECEVNQLRQLVDRGSQNGVPKLRLISPEELREIEPHVQGRNALHAPQSAIVDFRKVAERYAINLEESGGRIHFSTAFISAAPSGNGCQRIVTNKTEFDTRLVINCAGLHSDVIARRMGCNPAMRIIPFRGEYHRLKTDRQSLVNGLIYPVANPSLPFLGAHFTPRPDGAVEAGPNAILATSREGYRRRDFSLRDVSSTLSFPGFWLLVARNIRPGIAEINRSLRKSVLVRALQRLIPEIRLDDLLPAGSGVRAQAVDQRGNLIDDFRVEDAPGAIHVLSAPSPAATASLAIGQFIANKAEQRLI